jgi:hypothetical protein
MGELLVIWNGKASHVTDNLCTFIIGRWSISD